MRGRQMYRHRERSHMYIIYKDREKDFMEDNQMKREENQHIQN